MRNLFVLLLVTVAVGCSSKPKEGSPSEAPPPSPTKAVEPRSTAEPEPAQEASLVSAKPELPEWTGPCRKVVNEAGKAIPAQAQQRLQSAYSFQDKSVIVFVRSFGDTNCKKLLEANRFHYECDADPKKNLAKCKTVRRETFLEDKTWKEKPLVDSTGNSSVSEARYSVRFVNKKKAVLRTIDEADDESNVTLVPK